MNPFNRPHPLQLDFSKPAKCPESQKQIRKAIKDSEQELRAHGNRWLIRSSRLTRFEAMMLAESFLNKTLLTERARLHDEIK